MATTRRRSNKGVSGSGSGSNQPTLSFSAKSTRVTKPTAARDASLSSSLKKKQQQQQQPTLLKKDGGATEEAEPEPEAVTVVQIPTTPEPEVKKEEEEEEGEAPSHHQQEEFSISIPVRLSPRQQRQPAPTPRTRKILQTTTAATSSLAAVTSRRGREALAEKVTDGQIRKYWQAEEEKRKARRVHQESLSVHEKILRHFDISSQYGPCIGISRLARWRRADGLGLDPPVEVLAVLLKQDRSGQGKSGKLAYIDELAGAKENEDR